MYSVHPVVGQLKSHLNEGIWTDSTLLDLSFAKVLKAKNMEVHIIGQGLGYCQRLRDLLLTLKQTQSNSDHKQTPEIFGMPLNTAGWLQRNNPCFHLVQGSATCGS